MASSSIMNFKVAITGLIVVAGLVLGYRWFSADNQAAFGLPTVDGISDWQISEMNHDRHKFQRQWR